MVFSKYNHVKYRAIRKELSSYIRGTENIHADSNLLCANR
jgi:hypothetical protein